MKPFQIVTIMTLQGSVQNVDIQTFVFGLLLIYYLKYNLICSRAQQVRFKPSTPPTELLELSSETPSYLSSFFGSFNFLTCNLC